MERAYDLTGRQRQLRTSDKNDAAGAMDALIELLDRPEDPDVRAVERSLGQ
ncbi:hypothetical protein IV500_17670 [Paeniglutamicibacter antarcticus]|uniref:Uncharacterized protein n=1 Tax=Arthrobacter terrae TaxID=2935737 RepID=A0A931CTM3_9MICC|nr:hypothetical protein [Arthrobacter terrae]MBG0741199.1 hypothetical protein [Arthrobacter terrae]